MRTRWFWLAIALLGCDRATPEPAPRTSTPSRAPATSAAPKPAIAPIPWRLPAVKRLAAVGDVHGDLAATRAALRLVGAIDNEDDWVGGDLVVVQTGDQLDRGDDERAILDLLEAVAAKAKAAGGALHVLNGNHETMNVAGDFRYVTPGGFRAFADVRGGHALAGRFPAPQQGRARAFLPGGPYAKKLAERNVVLVVGDVVFAHGGVLPEHVKFGIERINTETRAWILGRASEPPALMRTDDAPVWTRAYSMGDAGAEACGRLAKTLESLGAARMVVGHTVQKSGVTNACDGKIWRIDVGLAAHYGGSSVQAITITDGEVAVVRAPKG